MLFQIWKLISSIVLLLHLKSDKQLRDKFQYQSFLLQVIILPLIQTKMLNIPSTVVDSNYRYRMPKMQIKQQSKGNGIRTNVVNLQDVAKSLRTDQAYILKFFGFQKASQTTEKSSETKSNKTAKTNTSYIIQGSFTEEDLRKVLDKFIDKYILCPKCKLPELNMYIANEKIHGKCDSCPFNGEIDNKHKLTGYIVKNPPVIKTQAIKQTKIIDKQEKGEEKSEKNGKKVEETVGNQKKQDDMGEQAKNLFEVQNLQFGSAELQRLIQHTRNFITIRKDKDFDIASAETVEDLKPLGLKKTLLAYILFNGLFTINIAKQVKQGAPMYKKLMKRLVSGSDENNQTQTLLNLQYLFLQVNKEKDYSKYLPTITYKLHENGLLSKDLILKWSQGKIKDFDKFFLYNDARNDQFLKINQQFIESLKDDDEEEES